ncbi:hypothetical protein [Hyalangium sp.]|uniref:hypothetical protein n=1 Tax=Hyalangium sp. TaxID=2028555 RepID=UPI002D3D8471|nr:hypothetical protein [Hyalangium sp.]HYI02435.1 hypothetical protein [Hyalangium sp.]
MTTPTQQDAPTMFYPLNPCGHLRGPGGGCIGSPECKREPVSAEKMGELVQRAGELRARHVAHPSQAFTGEGRATVADKLGSALTPAECLHVVIISLLGDKAVMTAEERATLPGRSPQDPSAHHEGRVGMAHTRPAWTHRKDQRPPLRQHPPSTSASGAREDVQCEGATSNPPQSNRSLRPFFGASAITAN